MNPRVEPVCSHVVLRCLLLGVYGRVVPLRCSVPTMVEMLSVAPPFSMSSCERTAGRSRPLPHRVVLLTFVLQLTLRSHHLLFLPSDILHLQLPGVLQAS